MKKWTPALFISQLESIFKEHEMEIKVASSTDMYYAISSLINQEIERNWKKTEKRYHSKRPKQLYYLSMEFLIGGLLKNNLFHYDMLDSCNQAMTELGFDPEQIFQEERDPGLGNGGLGRLAACFLDSMAALQYPGHGYGIRYRYGLFEQRIINGYQTELPDYWLDSPYPWEVRKIDEAVEIEYGGSVHMQQAEDGSFTCTYHNTDKVLAVPYDVPIVGFRNKVVNTLRLWSAEPADAVQQPNETEYYHQLEHHHAIEQISGFLYPDDSSEEGKLLRLKQQYFLVAASLQKILREYQENVRKPLSKMPEKVVIQINDTHPSLAIPEMMRILMDEESLGWDDAWQITNHTFAYTNHTLMSEALEKWPVTVMQQLLPRLYMIINEINERFCRGIWEEHSELRERIPEMAIIADGYVHMARLAVVGSFSVNGVAKLHTQILKTQEMKDFYHLYPKRFNNKTNGITHRRWLLMANPRLAEVITETISSHWITRPRELTHLLRHINDKPLLDQLDVIKNKNKQRLADYIQQTTGILVDHQSIFDVQIKRLHEYKRQLLNIFHVIYLYNELKENPLLDITPRTFIFAAKAAPSYYFAKEVIKLINTVASIVNHDVAINGKLKVVFLENYNVSLAERIIPAVDLSEQISTAGKEASGTGNMKMMMNGALTIGTLDGANIEMKQLVSEANIFLFGLQSDEVFQYYENGEYQANELYQTDDRLAKILDQLRDGYFGHEFKDICYQLLSTNDPYFILKDFDDYVETHQHIDQTYRNKDSWLSKSLVNIAHSGKFSSDRTIREYATSIWKL
ncbi:glycogen/starch/alpha-glucan phosphorylase [Gracilibacillus salinarum]|uniref:Alpha-1,4 glucan phosphorylase n=2 Tax=Gracilibacillus salinarum TaxID=2932255 RepID=A0ABY4GPN8_9BACI|nr:glycogen/starch/alpha-glucan phosphorylase [Gracilibacillus salinarum]UOQ86194.1 glycogen/starch/alpha-glucan phosphorylase [Gracilibacillus salinarum]